MGNTRPVFLNWWAATHFSVVSCFDWVTASGAVNFQRNASPEKVLAINSAGKNQFSPFNQESFILVPETQAVENHLDVLSSSFHCSSVLVCLQEEVEKVVSLLQEQARSLSRHGMKKHLRVLPMYSGLPYADQMKIFERVPHSVRKVDNTFPHLPH